MKDLIKSWIFRLGRFLTYLKATQASMILKLFSNLNNSIILIFLNYYSEKELP